MKQYYEDTQATESIGKKALMESSASDFLRQVFTNMVIGLLITGLAAWYVGTNEALLYFFLGNTILRWVVMLAPLGLVILMSARVSKMSFTNLSITFGIYSLINGISLSYIFYFFSLPSLTKVFFITAGTFGAMALVGYTTKVDLSKYRSILY
ncbi:MAG: Bax inhibitor-1 family protein, partial [Bacteroidota bacterium]